PELERFIVAGTYYATVTGDYHASLEAYRRALEIDSTNGTAMTNTVVDLWYLRNYPAAEELQERLVRLYPQAQLYYGNLVDGQRAAGKFQRARATLRSEEQALPGHPEIRWD